MKAKGRHFPKVLTGYWISLFALTHIPMPNLPPTPEGSDKGVHFFAYGILGFLLRKARPLGNPGWLLWLVIIAYAFFDETTQPFFNRSMEWGDILSDAIGAAFGIATQTLMTRRTERSS